MRQWITIPTEILNIILFHVTENDNVQERKSQLSQCALTCRTWKEIAQPLLFSKIELTESDYSCEQLCQLMVNNNKLGKHVKHLKGPPTRYSLTSLIVFDSLFPNLGKIELDFGSYDYPFFCKLITEEGKFRNLTTIPNPPDYKHVNMYLECLFTLRPQITNAYLLDDEHQQPSEYVDLCNKIYQFPKLKSICIHQEGNNSSRRNIREYVDSITVPKLIHIEKLELELAEPNKFHLLSEGLGSVQPSTNIRDLRITVYYERQLVIPNEHFMLYIMEKFPNLARIQLENSTLVYTRWISSLSQEYIMQPTVVTLRFLQYLCKIRDCDVSNIIVDDSLAILIKELFASISLQTGTKLPRIHLTYVRYDTERNNNIKALIDVKNDTVNGTRNIYIKLNINLALELEQQRLHLLFKEAGCFFTKVTLVVYANDQLMSSLNNIRKYCHKLEEIEINAEHLSTFASLPAIEEIIKDEDKNYSLKKLTLLPNSSLSTKQLCYITAHFPCLENLIIDKFFEAAYGIALITSTVNNNNTFSISLNTSSLKCLSINTKGVFYRRKIKGINVKVTTDAGNDHCVSLYKKEMIIGIDFCSYSFVLQNSHDNNMMPHNNIGKKHWVTFNIHCKKIEKLDVTFPTTITSDEEKKGVKYQTHSVLFAV